MSLIIKYANGLKPLNFFFLNFSVFFLYLPRIRIVKAFVAGMSSELETALKNVDLRVQSRTLDDCESSSV